nr:hypothetical protein [Schaalia odontolytica]
MVNDHDTLNLVTGAPAGGVIGGVVGHYFGEKTGDAINNGALN